MENSDFTFLFVSKLLFSVHRTNDVSILPWRFHKPVKICRQTFPKVFARSLKASIKYNWLDNFITSMFFVAIFSLLPICLLLFSRNFCQMSARQYCRFQLIKNRHILLKTVFKQTNIVQNAHNCGS